MNTVNRVRITRARAKRLGLTFTQRGTVYTLRDADDITLAVGPLATVDAYLIGRMQPKRPGPRPTTHAPEAWRRDVDDYLICLAAGGQRKSTIRLRRANLCVAARGLGCPPGEVTAEQLVNWLGKQQHLSQEARKSYRTTLRGFFVWLYEMGRVPVYIGDALPVVRVPKAPPRPASDEAWQAALANADRRTELMLRLAGEAGLRRAEIAQVHTADLMDGGALLVHGKGGKNRVVPISTYLVALIRQAPAGWLFPNTPDRHLTPEHVGKIISRALPDNWTAHTLRHRMASRAFRGSRNIRAVQALLGHESILTTQRYVAICDDEIWAAAAYAW
ncbi:tyrosine-type recombinase/integrase [Mycobacterium kansasii]|uniref:Phage integrase family protein n=4 Tax=Mycobacterium kansasii TaxID=1768 RepID=A0A1V3XA94_MYCKA|nr:tyrosine-type recombinase/integrase [Mycobacterium kansasii]AGZ51099.1 integrase [Mycobacterium kansasii ATCC 12478]EUA16390.1 phage integrase family protein [Mycobacterium kansasii 662]KEP39196.1 integrase [Mycobacterium kansasii]OOK75371.1 phage integrase family protein [Mycobacterium kansasii]OOK80985.1 phage integrase family protein [Mycobacterium kansasii]